MLWGGYSMYAVGLMSGTSLDGVDAVLTKPYEHQCIDRVFKPYSQSLQQSCLAMMQQETVHFDDIACLSHELALLYADAVMELLQSHPDKSPTVIGCHGQAVRHQPDIKVPYSLQLGCPYTLSQLTKIPVVFDFRQADLVACGQGAPLSPIFHHELFKLDDKTVVINLGGIANISYVDSSQVLRGFDTGPANSLLDSWIALHQEKSFDKDGLWALSGDVQADLLSELLNDTYFLKAAPKSLDKMYFSLEWLQKKISAREYRVEDVQRTLLEFTVAASAQSIKGVVPACNTLIVCGGGAKNTAMLQSFEQCFSTVKTVVDFGYEPSDIEPMMMAWLAAKRWDKQQVDLRSVTGSQSTVTLGALVIP